MPSSTGLDDRRRAGKVIKPRQMQYVNLQEGSPFPTIMHQMSMSSMLEDAELHGKGHIRRGMAYSTNPSPSGSALFLSSSNDISDMHAEMLGSVMTPMAYDVSGVNMGRKTAEQLEEEKRPKKLKFGRRERLDTAAAIGAKLSQTEKLMGRQTGEYARRRAEQLEQFRGTPEPGIMKYEYSQIHAVQQHRLSKGSATSMKTMQSFSDNREESLLATFLPPHRSNEPMQGWQTPVPEGKEFSGFPKMREYSPPPGHMAFNPRSMSPLRDTVMHSSPSPIGWSADEHHAPSPSPGPAHPESQGRDSRKEKLLKGIDVDILPSDLRQNRALRMIPRSNPIVQEAEAAEEQRNTVILMPLPSASPVGKGRSGASTSVFYHPQHKLPDRREKKITLPPASGFERNSNTGTNAAGMALKKKASMKKANSIKSVTADGSPDDEKSHGQKPSSAKSTRSVGRSEEHQERKHEGGKQAKPHPPEPKKPPPKPQRQAEKKPERKREQPLSMVPTRNRRERYLGGALSKTAEQVLDNLEKAQKKEDALRKEIAAENARIRAEKGLEPGAIPEMVQKNIDMCTVVRVDPQARLQEKMQHSEQVRQRAKELKDQALEEKIYFTKRAERLKEAAAQRHFLLEEEARVKALVPIFAIVSTLSGLGDQINAHRAHVERKRRELWAVITMQRIFRGHKARKDYHEVISAVKFLQKSWRVQFVWRIKLLKQTAATRILQFIREVHNQSDFIGAMKVAIHRIVKESRKKSQMKTLSRGIMTTVLRGQWSKAEIKEINRKKDIERVKRSRFMATLAAAVEKEKQQDGNPQAPPAAAPPPKVESSADAQPKPAGAFGKLGGKGKLQGMVKKNMKKMRSLVGQSMPNASTVMDDLTPIPDLVKLLVVEAFINLREEQYVRVMGVYWLQKSRYFRKRRAYDRSQARMTQSQSSNGRAVSTRGGSQAPIPPKLYPMPRGSRANELKVMMQQGVYELTIMEQENCWDLKEKRQLSEGETSLLSDVEKERIPEVQERLKKRLFMCNISVKANLMTPYQGIPDEHHDDFGDEPHDDL